MQFGLLLHTMSSPNIFLHGNKALAWEYIRPGMSLLFRAEAVRKEMGVPVFAHTTDFPNGVTIRVSLHKEIKTIEIFAEMVTEPVQLIPKELILPERFACPPAFTFYQRKYTGMEKLNAWPSYNIPVTKNPETEVLEPLTDPIGNLLIYIPENKSWRLGNLDKIPDPHENKGWARNSGFGSASGYIDLPREAYHGGWWGLEEAHKDLYSEYKKCDLLTWAGCPTSVGSSYSLADRREQYKRAPAHWGDYEDIQPNNFIDVTEIRPWFWFQGKKIHVVSSLNALTTSRGNVVGVTIIPDHEEKKDYFYALTDGTAGPAKPWEKGLGSSIVIYRAPVLGAEDNINSTLWEEVGTITVPNTTIRTGYTSTIVNKGRSAYVLGYSSRDSQYRHSIIEIDIEHCSYETAFEEEHRALSGPTSYAHTDLRNLNAPSAFSHCVDESSEPCVFPFYGPGPAFSRYENTALSLPKNYIYDVFFGLDKLYTYVLEQEVSASIDYSSSYPHYRLNSSITGSSDCSDCFYVVWNAASLSNAPFYSDSGSYFGVLVSYLVCYEGLFEKEISRLKVAEVNISRQFSKTFSGNSKSVGGDNVFAPSAMGTVATGYNQSLSYSASGLRRSVYFHHPKVPNNWHYIEATLVDTPTSNIVSNKSYDGPNGTQKTGTNTISNGVPCSHGPVSPWYLNSSSGVWTGAGYTPHQLGDETFADSFNSGTSNAFTAVLTDIFFTIQEGLDFTDLLAPIHFCAPIFMGNRQALTPFYNASWNNLDYDIGAITGQWIWSKNLNNPFDPNVLPAMTYYPNHVAVHRPVKGSSDWSYVYHLPRIYTQNYPGPTLTTEPYRATSPEWTVAAHLTSNPNVEQGFGTEEWMIGSFRCWNPGWTVEPGGGLAVLRAGDYHGFHDTNFFSNVLTLEQIKKLTDKDEDFLDGLAVM